jgi:hypothetical protein
MKPISDFPADYQNDLFPRAMRELERIKDESRLVVIITQGLVELVVNTLVDQKCKDAKQIKSEGRLILLHELNVLSDHDYRLLTWLRFLRHDAAHLPFFNPKADRFEMFADEDHRDPGALSALCRLLLFDLIVKHQDTIIPILFASASKANTVKIELGPPEEGEAIPLRA